jgi:hypothetical protein
MTIETLFRVAFPVLLMALFAMRFYLEIADCPRVFDSELGTWHSALF